MQPKLRNFLLVAATLFVAWLFHPFWVRNFENLMESRGWDKWLSQAAEALPEAATMVSEYMPQGFWAGVFLTLAIWGSLEIVYAIRRRGRPEAGEFAASGLYVGRMVVNTKKLETDFFIEIGAFCFNSSGNEIEIQGIRGTAEIKNGDGGPYIPLPASTLLLDRIGGVKKKNNTDFIILFEQRIPRDCMEIFSSLTSKGVEIKLSGLKIEVKTAKKPYKTAHIPLWSSIRVRIDTENPAVHRVVEGTINVMLGSSTNLSSDTQPP